MIKIIDISMDVLYERAQGEKKLLTVINATVSHEMRNPINSISALSIKQDETNDKLRILIQKLDTDLPAKTFKDELIIIYNESVETAKVQNSSSKILCLLVNDILDYAQMKQGKFRKDCTQFDVSEAINEIIQIQKLKAEFLEINLYSIFEGFDNNNFLICSDKQRIQQVLLNLQSNSLKFTRRGGEVEIKCKLIKQEDDLEFVNHIEHYEAASNGMIQVTVTDTGIGIKDKDKDKLFKIFGFLESSK